VSWPLEHPLILASGSPRRRELLAQLSIPFEVITSNTPEKSESDSHGLTPSEFCWWNSAKKGFVVQKLHPRRHILAADTVVAIGTTLLGKPKTHQEAALFLEKLSGHSHEVCTAVQLYIPGKGWKGFVEKTVVTFQDLSPQRIQDYLKQVHVLDKAGGYALQEHPHLIIQSVHGSHSNVIGLPIERLRKFLTFHL
jgi:septum formation protein